MFVNFDTKIQVLHARAIYDNVPGLIDIFQPRFFEKKIRD